MLKGQSWGVGGINSLASVGEVFNELDLETKERLVGKTRSSILVRWGGGQAVGEDMDHCPQCQEEEVRQEE